MRGFGTKATLRAEFCEAFDRSGSEVFKKSASKLQTVVNSKKGNKHIVSAITSPLIAVNYIGVERYFSGNGTYEMTCLLLEQWNTVGYYAMCLPSIMSNFQSHRII